MTKKRNPLSAADILIAEEKRSVAQELKKLLEDLGYEVVEIACSGEEAVEKTEKLRPQVVLMNIRLKGTRDGIQTGSYIRDFYDTPIVYVVDYTSQATIRRAGATGPFGYIFRPFDEKQIFAIIETALIRHQLESKLQQSRQWLNTTLTSIGDGVIATDEQGLVRFINPIAMEHTGWHHTEAVGRPLSEIFSFVDENSHEPIDILDLRNRLPRTASKKGCEGLLLPRSGTPMPVESNITSIQDGKGKIYGMVLVFRDVTQQREAIREIKRQADRAEALLQVASQLNSQPELETVLNTVCEIANRSMKASGTALLLQGARKESFRMMAAISQDPAMKKYSGVRFEIPKAVLRALLSRENPVVVLQDDLENPNLPYAELCKKLNIKTLAIAALFTGSDLIGTLISAFIQKQKVLPEDEIALLRGLADQASSAIENAELFEQVRAGRERQQKLAKSLVDIQEAERRHIAKELHDHLGQVLTGLQFTLETTKNQASGTQRSNLEEIQNAVSDIIRQVREMSLNLRPSMLDDMGLLPTLLWHIDRYTSQTGIRVNFQCDEFVKRLPTEIETAAYRIVQEALTNVARYAQVKEVFVGLVVQENTLWVEVLDNGKGFDTALELDKPSSGLGGMRERARLLGGYVLVESFIDQGTQIVAALPLTGQPLERRKYGRNRSVG
ncbi:MAG TPA: response regulator [Anaerolineales bacterium]|nr:response regulator [Anaerolineales bacterium]